MLSSYDLTNFSKKLKSIRNSLGYSQSEVAEKTGVNSDTLRRLENGMSIPRFDTLEVLSQFYKENLIILLDSYKVSSNLSYFYELIDYHMVNDDIESINKTISSFDDHIKSNTLQLIDNKEIEQLKLFFQGLAVSYKVDKNSYLIALDLLIKAMQIGNPLFQLDKWELFKFNSLEIRILLTIASIEGNNRNCTLSNNIILHILNYLDFSVYSKFFEKMLIVKCFCIISYNFHRLDKHELALEYSEKGINYCVEQSILAYLHFMLFRKGSAMFFLGLKDYDYYIEQAISLLKIQKKDNAAENYSYYLDKYRKEFKTI